jgi:acyl-coenzyme A thioesterase PaaI-like protein
MCFACGQDNPIGLKIHFAMDGDVCRAEFTPGAAHVGWEDTVHGGIIYSALDDVTANVIYLTGRKAHTARAEIRYRQPARVGEAFVLSGWIEREKGRLVLLKGEARRKSDGELIADCESAFMIDR